VSISICSVGLLDDLPAVQPNFAVLFGLAVSELHVAQLDLPGRVTFFLAEYASPGPASHPTAAKKNRRGCRPRR